MAGPKPSAKALSLLGMYRARPIRGARCATSLKSLPLSTLRNSIRPRPRTEKLDTSQRHNYHNTQAEETTLAQQNTNLRHPLTKGLTAVHTLLAFVRQRRCKSDGNDDQHLRLSPPPRGPSAAPDQRPPVPPRDQKRGQSSCPSYPIFETGMEHVPSSDTPELPNQPPARKLHDQWDLEMDLIGQGEDNHYIELKVKYQIIHQLSQQLGEKVKNSRAGREAKGDTNKIPRLSIQAKNPEVLAAIISAVHGADPSWRINCFEDFVILATTCWKFGCRTDSLGTLLSHRPTWSPNGPDQDQARIEQLMFAALVFKLPEMFEQATQKMVMDFEDVSEDSEHGELLPEELRRKIKQKGRQISEEIMVFVKTYVSDCLDQLDPASAGAFTAAMHYCLKSVGYHLFNDAAEKGENRGATHLLEALENLPLQPPAKNTVEIGLCVLDQIPDSPTAASHGTGSSNSSSLPYPVSAIPPRRARAALVIAKAAADLWDKRATFAEKIHHLVSYDSTKKLGLKDTDEEKYVKLVENFQKKLKEAKPKWVFKGFDLRQFQTSTDYPQRPPGAGAAEEIGTHSHE
ncbi:hypothetical protein C7212DRAFT_357391 [Tuber magnatum]|uniref:Uncharacterized protein n=1 Tax=Tuber magnatum TaxID=42249 RepID=A0A317SSW4_9PEZI|nr:hypothetical protein C7212DRAFT_357391 [Tuber magnatum]